MAKEEKLILKGKVVEALPGGMFRVSIQMDEQHSRNIICTLGGKLKISNIRVVVGDEVDAEISTYDLGKGRITFRHTGNTRQGENLDADYESAA